MRKYLLIILMVMAAGVARAQTVGVKTNILYDATASANLGIEFGLANHWTLDLSGNYNGWAINDRKWKHWFVQPEGRYWFCSRFSGHFLAVNAIAGSYNIGNLHNNIKFLGTDFKSLTDYRYEGWGAGAGIAYGYAWILGKHWNLEAEIGVGWIYSRYDKFDCEICGKKVASGESHNYFGPTKLALTLEYIF